MTRNAMSIEAIEMPCLLRPLEGGPTYNWISGVARNS